ncbi:unnamed protein product, partial [Tetraodon nigroviridis]
VTVNVEEPSSYFFAITELPMAFQNLCNFETFQRFWSHYGYEGKLEDTIKQDFSRIKGTRFKGIALQEHIYLGCETTCAF